jgi:probable rRNA maturation factor
VIARDARAGGIPLEAHYAHLMVHAMLHLQGYDHADSRDAGIMEAREAAILHRLGYPNPYRGAA